MAALVVLLVTALALATDAFKIGSPQDDLVTNIPGLLYNVSFDTYSGYLDAGKYGPTKQTGYMHYMLTESKSNPETDPILLWLNGGPGCSSFSGAFEELGPFYINKDGATLYENIYSWNTKANVLFFESPIGVGYSFLEGTPNYADANDDQTLEQNYNALNSFFKKFPDYKNRTFFIAGESYAGIYLPMLGAKLMDGIISEDFVNPNFQGIAIGNGYMDIVALQNALVLWSNYHGRISLQDWETLKSPLCCIKDANQDADSCDFYTKAFNTTTWNDFTPLDNVCGQILNDVITKPPTIDPYNYYEDCYGGSSITTFRAAAGRSRKGDSLAVAPPHNTASIINYFSTDFLYGYPCWQEDAVSSYFNKPEVQKAFHIDYANISSFHDCNTPMYNKYVVKYKETSNFFKNMFANVQKANLQNFRVLVYNGDVDTVCNFIGDAKFVSKITTEAKFTENSRQKWTFRGKTGGFVQHYSGSLSIDVLTIKGAGHMVPMDRPGPALQMINAFMSGANYSNDLGVNMIPTPIPLNP